MQIECPNCHGEIDYEDYVHGECPECNCKFAVQEQNAADSPGGAAAAQSEEPVSSAAEPQADTPVAHDAKPRRRQYRWGRRYIKWSRLAAWLTVLVCVGLAVLSLWNGLTVAIDARRNALQRADDEAVMVDTQELRKRHQAVVDCFSNLTALLSGNGSGGAFLKMPDALVFKTYAFPEEYDTVEQIGQAQEQLKEIERDVAAIKESMAAALAACLQSLQRQNQQSKLSLNTKGTSGAAQRQLLVMPGVRRHFYVEEAEDTIRDILNGLMESAEDVRENDAASGKTREEMGRLMARMKYIIENLLSREAQAVTSTVASGEKRQGRVVTSRSSTYDFSSELSMLERLPGLVTSSWEIDSLVLRLDGGLEEARRHFTEAERLRREAWKRFRMEMTDCIRGLVQKLFVGLAAAFLVLVFADYLQAHFDTADSTTKTLEILER